MVSSIRSAFLAWLPFAVAITCFCGIMYGTVQQDFRRNANDPQIQIAEDAAAALEAGVVPAAVVRTGQFPLFPAQTDIAKSLAPFLIIYDEQGIPLESTAELNGKVPVPPQGVFEYVRGIDTGAEDTLFRLRQTNIPGEERVTWQPDPDVRIAAVIVRVNGTHPGFVLAGRSLREVEKRVENLMLQIFVGWIVTLCVTFAALLFIKFLQWIFP